MNHFGMKLNAWKSCINKNKTQLSAAIAAVLVNHISQNANVEELTKQSVEVEIIPVAAPPKPSRVPVALTTVHIKNPKSRDRNRYWLTRTGRLFRQIESVCWDVRGSAICFFRDTLRRAHGLEADYILAYNGELNGVPQQMKDEIEAAILKASFWATNKVKLELAAKQFEEADKTISSHEFFRRITLHEKWRCQAALVRIFRIKAHSGDIYPEAKYPKTGQVNHHELEAFFSENTKKHMDEQTTTENITKNFAKSCFDFDKIHLILERSKETKTITENEFNKQMIVLGEILRRNAVSMTSNVLKDARDIMKDVNIKL